jgi:hypothetical protein
MAIDEHANGFASSTSRKNAAINNNIMIVLNNKGGMISEEKIITKEWTWAKTTSNKDTLTIFLNENLTFTFKDKKTMTLQFQCENIKYMLDISEKKKRDTNYLDNAKRIDGKIIPQMEYKSLKQRTIEFNEDCRAQNNKIHPKSKNLSDLVSHIVAGLEVKFDGIDSRMHTSPGAGTVWKSNALTSTLTELPKLPLMGTETGFATGFGKQIYAKADEAKALTIVPSHLVTAKGTWRNEIQVRDALLEKNPPIKPSAMLRQNSGKYSTSLIIDPELVTLRNPTGMAVPIGKPLRVIPWTDLKKEMNDILRGDANSQGLLTVALLYRNPDNRSREFERVAEYVNLELAEKDKEGPPSPYRLIRIDISDDCSILHDLGVKDGGLPCFVMYYGGKVVYAGECGGRKVKVKVENDPQVLIIEPNFKTQISMEKSLRKMGCDTFLCLSVGEAINRIQKMTFSGEGVKTIMDLILISDEINSTDLDALSVKLSELIKQKRVCIAGLVNVLGPNGLYNYNAVKWSSDFTITDQFNAVLPEQLSRIVQIAIQKPVKASSIKKALSMRVVPPEDANFGLTAVTFKATINQVLDAAKGGKSLFKSQVLDATTSDINRTYIGTKLSIFDTKMRGTNLVKN